MSAMADAVLQEAEQVFFLLATLDNRAGSEGITRDQLVSIHESGEKEFGTVPCEGWRGWLGDWLHWLKQEHDKLEQEMWGVGKGDAWLRGLLKALRRGILSRASPYEDKALHRTVSRPAP